MARRNHCTVGERGPRPAVSRGMLGAPVLALAAACAGPDYGAYLDRYVGAPESALAARWGPPDWRNPAADGSAELHYIYEEPVLELLSELRKVSP